MRRIPLLAALAALLVCACAKESGTTVIRPIAPQDEAARLASVFVPGQVNVYFDEELTALVEREPELAAIATRASGLGAVMQELGVVSYERVFPVDEEYEDRHREFGLHRWYRVCFEGGTPSPQAVERFKLVSGVLTARPVHKVSMASEPFFNDPLEPKQWQYHNDSKTWADVNVVSVWKNYTKGRPDVIVSVVDGGIDLQHEDLAAAVVPPGDNGSKSFMINGNAYRITGHDHGTHVAGTIGAVNNNGLGVCGIAGGDAAAGEAGVRLMSCQVFQDGNEGGANFEAALVWGADHGAVVSNNSWGYKFNDESGKYLKDVAESTHKFYLLPNTGEGKDSQKDAIDYFNQYAGISKGGQQTGPMAGGVVFFSAGNDGRPYGAPACYPGCVAVGSINAYGNRSDFSNYGEWVDICAPGSDILSTAPGNDYAFMSGTSMSCPHVTGVAALVVSYCGGLGFTGEQLRDKLIGGGNNADVPSSYRIGPLVDALGALAYGTGEPPAKVEDYEVDEIVSNNVTLTVTVPAASDGQPAYGIRILASETLSDLEGCDPRSPSSAIRFDDIVIRDAGVGDQVTGTIGDLGFNATYYLAVSAFDYGRNFSAITPAGTVTTGSNHAPVITTDYKGDFKFNVHDNFDILFKVTDIDNHVLSVLLERDVNDEGVLTLWETGNSDEYILKVLGKAAPEGKYRSVIYASDSYGLEDQFVIEYEVLPNQAPIQVKPIDNVILHFAGDQAKVDMTNFIVDPDGEVLKYNIDISDRSVVQVNQNSGSELTLTAIADSGLAVVTLDATDAGGQSISASFKILVRSAEQEIQAYPNPVVDNLYVGTGEVSAPAVISFYNSVGSKVHSGTYECSAFEPAVIDMTRAGAGVYTMKVEYGGKLYKSIIIKK